MSFLSLQKFTRTLIQSSHSLSFPSSAFSSSVDSSCWQPKAILRFNSSATVLAFVAALKNEEILRFLKCGPNNLKTTSNLSTSLFHRLSIFERAQSPSFSPKLTVLALLSEPCAIDVQPEFLQGSCFERLNYPQPELFLHWLVMSLFWSLVQMKN